MQRYLVLDFIRGCAILGILLLNIIGFGLPSAAYLNPAWQGSITLLMPGRGLFPMSLPSLNS